MLQSGTFDFDRGFGVLEQRVQPEMPSPTSVMLFTEEGLFLRPDLNAPKELNIYAAVLEGTGKTWIRQSSADERVAGPWTGDPRELLRVARAASDVQKVGSSAHRGEELTIYEARLDVDRALQEVPERARDSWRATIAAYWGDADSIPFELGVDGDGRLGRLAFSIPDEKSVELEFFDYGVDVNVEAPAESEVMTAAEFAARAKSLCSKSGYGGQSDTAACLVGTMFEDDD